jgi:hypothetical protein
MTHPHDADGPVLEQVETGPNAHGSGRTADGRELAFRVRGAALLVEVYREGAAELPAPEDVEATATVPAGGTDLHDDAVLRALVADALGQAGPVERVPSTTVKAHLGRVGSVMDIL